MNEDRVLRTGDVYAVADGVPGRHAGGVASTLAIEALRIPSAPSDEAALVRAVERASRRIHALGGCEPDRAGMATTLTAAVVAAGEVALAHVGDSRAYRLRAGRLERLTDDHSLSHEAGSAQLVEAGRGAPHRARSVLTRALGLRPEVVVDSWTYPAGAGDGYLLCSDGLTSMVPDGRVRAILLAHPELDRAADRLIETALRAGGRDNVTVVLFRVDGEACRSARAPHTAG